MSPSFLLARTFRLRSMALGTCVSWSFRGRHLLPEPRPWLLLLPNAKRSAVEDAVGAAVAAAVAAAATLPLVSEAPAPYDMAQRMMCVCRGCVSTLRYFAAFSRCIVVLLYRIPPHQCADWPMHCVLVM